MTAPSDIARLIHEVLTNLGFDADAHAVANQVRRLDFGLPAEGEFSVVCAWLGQCRLIHKLDQKQTPALSKELFQVPDLLACFDAGGPVLIEVKSSTDRTLSLRPDYHAKLTRYAEMLRLPLLIAWKHHSLWTLVDIRQLRRARTNYNISYAEALRQSLLGVLAGDVAYRLQPGSGIHLRLNKEELVKAEANGTGYTETWQMRIGEVSFSRADGVRASLHAETTQLLATWDLESQEEHHPDHILQSFVVTENGGMEFAHRALVNLLASEAPAPDGPRWRALLTASEVTRSIKSFSTALERGLAEGVVRYIFHIRPADMPEFLDLPQA
jgi:Holliday junction resolvase